MLLTAAAADELDIGSEMPLAEVKMADVGGKNVSLKDAMGENGLLVVFSCNTCPWVNAWEDRYISVSKLSQKKGVGMIAINPNEGSRENGDSMDDMQSRAKKAKYDFYYTLDKESKLASAFGASRTPQIYLFNNTDYRFSFNGKSLPNDISIKIYDEDKTNSKRILLKEVSGVKGNNLVVESSDLNDIYVSKKSGASRLKRVFVDYEIPGVPGAQNKQPTMKERGAVILVMGYKN